MLLGSAAMSSSSTAAVRPSWRRRVAPVVVAVLGAASLSAQGSDQRQSLLQAIQRGDTPAVTRLLAAGASPNATDDEKVPALMLATLFADVECMTQLLKRGADPNHADGDGVTALMWAMPDIRKARVLIEHGANVNARSTVLGRTPLLIAAGSPGSVDVLTLLLARGADLRARDATGFSALAVAMLSSDVDVLRFLADRGLDPKEEIPVLPRRLMFARARPAAIEFAMARGVAVPGDVLLRSNWQSPALLARWIEGGADPNARGGGYGVTPLLTVAASEVAGAESLRVLLEHGADPNVADAEGEKPLDWATYRDDRAKIALLEQHGATRGEGPRRAEIPPAGAGVTDRSVSVGRSVSLLLKASPGAFEGRRCFTCHHNALPAEAAALARRKGLTVAEDLAAKNTQDILAVFTRAAGPIMQGQPTGVPGAVGLTVGYGLVALASEGHRPDKATAAMTHWLLATQMPDGSWLGNGVNRPPIESSTVSHTAMAVRGLMLYPTPGDRPRVDRALARTRDWLVAASAPTSEERAMRLMGLAWTRAPRPAIAAAMRDVVSRQATSGGWSQLPQLAPDAYATGQALVALHEAGMAVTDDAYQKGVSFLLSTQYPDGSWLVRTRSFPTQPYYESGFPFGRHQWVSAAATAWAARAIALTLPDAAR